MLQSMGSQKSDTTERLNNHRSEKEAITKDSKEIKNRRGGAV